MGTKLQQVMTFPQWASKYSPRGTALMVDHDRLDLVRAAPMDKVWTVLKRPVGWVIRNGLRAGVVIGFFISEEPFGLEDDLSILYKPRTLDTIAPTPLLTG